MQPDLVDSEEEWEVEAILDSRKRGRTKEWLVRWEGFGPAGDEWLRKENLKGCEELAREFEQALSEGPNVPKEMRRPK